MRCSVLPPHLYFIRKATVCLHPFIPICADRVTVGMVIHMFDSFTGYLRLFDSRAFYYITKVEEEYTQRFENIKETEAFPSELLTEKTEYDEKIIEFVDEIISNLHTLKKFNTAGKYEKPIPLNRDFLFFLKNLKLELLYKSGGISLDENDPLYEIQMLDDITMERLFNPDIDGIVDKMPLELQKELEFEHLERMHYDLYKQHFHGNLKKESVDEYEKAAQEYIGSKNS